MEVINMTEIQYGYYTFTTIKTWLIFIRDMNRSMQMLFATNFT